MFSIPRASNPYLATFATLTTSADAAACLQSERAKLLGLLRRAPGQEDAHDHRAELGLHLCHVLSDLVDAFLSRLLTLSCLRVGVEVCAPSLALIATGGYGRRELCPFSDIDLTFVPLRESDPRTDRLIRDMFTQIMDVCIGKCGLKVGYGYRLLEDCVSLDHQTASGLLDARLIAGNERLFIQLEDAFWTGFNSTEFIFDKLAERRQALAKWGHLPRVVEPQLKEGAGGLRDIHTAMWLVQARENLAAARMRGARGLEVLQRTEYLSAEEAQKLGEAREKLLQARNLLHGLSGAARDLLVRTRQEEIAEHLGYDSEEQNRHSPPVERFMADLYPHLAFARRMAEHTMQRVENSRLMLGVGLDCRRKRIVPANGALETEDPTWLLWACELAQKYDLAFHYRLEQACADLLNIHPEVPQPLVAAQVFTRILSKTGKIAPIAQRMAELGILGWFVPEFARIMDLIPYDPSHEYTVGQHTLCILRYLDQLADERENDVLARQAGEEWPDMRRVLRELGHPEQLMLAVLLHDCGKSLPGGTHMDVGAELAEQVCQRLGWSANATANVVFLVRHHLLMAETSRWRDLNLNETIATFARIVDDTDRLDMLYLLTYADTRAVGENVWSQVNGRFLHELWRRTSEALSEQAGADVDAERLARTRKRMVRELKLDNLPEEEVTEHVQAMPPHYLLNQNLDRIAQHIGMVRRVRQGESVVDFYDARDATYSELTVCALDDPQPGLLAKIAAVLYAGELTVHSAQVFTRFGERDRIALDTLWVDFRGRQLSDGKQSEIAAWLGAVLRGELTIKDVLKKRRTANRVPTALSPTLPTSGMGSALPVSAPFREDRTASVLTVRNDLSSSLTLIEIEDPDVPGGLFWTSQALAELGWDIQSARVSVWHGMARASFYVAGARAFSEFETRERLTKALAETIS